jgi:hypothetical protein
MPKNKPAFDEWGRYQGTPEQQGCISRLMIPGVALMVLGCLLVYAFGGNPSGMDQAVNTAANANIAHSAMYGSGENALSAVFCFGFAGMFGMIVMWGLSRRSGGGDGGNGEN